VNELYDGELPEPPDNLEFLELFTPEKQEQIDTRFQVGIEKNRNALREAALRRERSERMTQARKERRAIAREAFLASRFNPVLRSRP